MRLTARLARMKRYSAHMGAPLMAAGSALALAGCAATPSSYMGIDISGVEAAPLAGYAISGPSPAGMELVALYEKAKALDCPIIADEETSSAECAALSKQMIAKAMQARAERLSGRSSLPVGPASLKHLSLQSLARRAQAGDKQAQLELGIRFEEGRGVERDLKKAKKLYGKAASDSGGTIWVYSPPVGNGTSGRVIPVNTGAKQSGLAEAKRRLEALK